MQTEELIIVGSGGGKGGGRQGGREDPDTLRSVTLLNFVDLISEGEIEGFIWTPSPPAWTSGMEIPVVYFQRPFYVKNAGKIYEITQGGATAVTAPTHSSGLVEHEGIFYQYRGLEGETLLAKAYELPFATYFNQVPLRNPDGTINIEPPDLAYTVGTVDQDALPEQEAVYSPISNAQKVLRADAGEHVVSITPGSDKLKINIRVNGLFYIDADDGDVHGASVSYQIKVTYTTGATVNTVDYGVHEITGKTRNFYIRTHTISLQTGFDSAQLKVSRVTPDATTARVSDVLVFDSASEGITAELTYPNSAMFAATVDSEQVNSVPQRGYRIRGIRVQIPSNYDPEARTYSDPWDGTFVTAWTNNPAWIFYDLLTDPRYGLGKYFGITDTVTESPYIDKWGLYEISKYCDALVDDGKGGTEPRFACNVYVQNREEAYDVIKNFASIFRGMTYWSSGLVHLAQDRDYLPFTAWDRTVTYSLGQYVYRNTKIYKSLSGSNLGNDPEFDSSNWVEEEYPSSADIIFNRTNVVDGVFSYSGTAKRARHTVALVGWNDPLDFYNLKVEYVEDADGIAELGVNSTQFTSFACTSRGQAIRAGKWALLTELHETEAIRFRTGLDAMYLRPGHIMAVSDPLRSTKRLGGRIAAATASQITLDADVTFDSGKDYFIYVLNPESDHRPDATEPEQDALKDLLLSEKITNPGTTTRVVNLDQALSAAPKVNSVWVIASDDAPTQQFRVLSISEVENGVFEVSGVEHVPGKHAAIEEGIELQDNSYNLPNPFTVSAPTNITIENEFNISPTGAQRKLNVSWDKSEDIFVTHYLVEYRYDNSNWIEVGRALSPNLSFEVRTAAVYTVRVKAVNQLGQSSAYLYGSFELDNQIIKNATITGLEIEGQGNDTEFAGNDVTFTWRFNSEDTFSQVGDSAQGIRHPFLKGYVIQIIRPTDGRIVREVTIPPDNPTYTYTKEDNQADNGVPLRTFQVKVAALDLANSISVADSLEVTNPPPLLGGQPPLINSSINFSTKTSDLIIEYVRPSDPDFEGIYVFAKKDSLLLSEIVDADGEILQSAFDTLLKYQGSDNIIRIPLDTNDWKIVIVPFDTFGNSDLNVYGVFDANVSTVTDTIAPLVPTVLDVRSAIEFAPDQTQLIRLTAYFYAGGLAAADTLTDWASSSKPDSDLASYNWGLRELDLASPSTIFPEIYGSAPARVEDGGQQKFVTAIDPGTNRYVVMVSWVVKPNTAYEFRVSAEDFSGNVSAWSPKFIAYAQGDTQRPAVPASISFAVAFKNIFFDLTGPADKDCDYINVYEKRDSSPIHWNGAEWRESLGGPAIVPVARIQCKGASARVSYVHQVATAGPGENYYFFFTAVDTSGNESSTALASGLVEVGLLSPQDVDDEASDLTSLFGDVVILEGLTLTNNSFNGVPGSQAGAIHWNGHTIYHRGVGYPIVDGFSPAGDKYVVWTVGDTDYKSYTEAEYGLDTDSIRTGTNKFLVFENNSGTGFRSWFYAASAVLGTAWIRDAAIKNAMIENLVADKIITGSLTSATVSIASGGVIKSDQATSVDVGAGFWLDEEDFRIGDPAAGRLKWDGSLSQLSIVGGIRVSTANNNLTSGGPGLILDQGEMGYYNGSGWTARISSDGTFLFQGADSQNKFEYTSGGLFRLIGDAVIAGLHVGPNNMWYRDAGGSGVWKNADTPFFFSTDEDGRFSIGEYFWYTDGNGTPSAQIGPLSLRATKMYLGAGNWGQSDTPFYVDSSDQFSLGAKFTWDGTNLNLGGTNSKVTIGSGANAVYIQDGLGIWAGDATFASAPFSIGVDGVMKTGYVITDYLSVGAVSDRIFATMLQTTAWSNNESNITKVMSNVAGITIDEVGYLLVTAAGLFGTTSSSAIGVQLGSCFLQQRINGGGWFNVSADGKTNWLVSSAGNGSEPFSLSRVITFAVAPSSDLYEFRVVLTIPPSGGQPTSIPGTYDNNDGGVGLLFIKR